jgi:hypothetical protein
MKHIFCSSFFLLFALALSAQKVVNDPNAEARPVGAFHALSISSAFEVHLTQGAEDAVAVSAGDQQDMADIKTEVKDGVLKIYFQPAQKKSWSRNHKLKAYVSARMLDRITISGATNVTVDGALTATGLKLNLSGASKLKGRLVVSGPMDVQLSGASDIEVTGSANEMNINASGASDVRAYEFTAATCKIDASGASSVRLTIDKELSAKLSGASSVSYKGGALIRDIKTSGASSISKKS